MREIEEAEYWLKSAEELLWDKDTSPSKYTVVTAMCVHSIIRANDALTNKFLFETAKRHEDTPRLFLKLISLGKIDKKYKSLVLEVLAPAVRIKSFVDYRGSNVTQASAVSWVNSTKRFLEAAKEILK